MVTENKSDIFINKDMNNLYIRRIKNLMSDNKVTWEKLSEVIGMSREGLFRSVNNDAVKVSTLIDIAKYFKVHVTYFFDENQEYEKPDVDKVMKVMADIIKERI